MSNILYATITNTPIDEEDDFQYPTLPPGFKVPTLSEIMNSDDTPYSFQDYNSEYQGLNDNYFWSDNFNGDKFIGNKNYYDKNKDLLNYSSILDDNSLTKDEKVDFINEIGQSERDEYDKELLRDYGRIGAGALLEGASLHPIFNVPYVGTGIGGAMYSAGDAIVRGDSLSDIGKSALTGFAVGETIGAVPYAGKYLSNTKALRPITQRAKTLSEAIGESPLVNEIKRETIDRMLLPTVRKMRAGGNFFDKTESGILYDTLSYRDEWVKINGKDYRVLNLPKKDYGKILHILDTYIGIDNNIGDVLKRYDDKYAYIFQKVSPTDYKFIRRERLK